MAAVVSAIAINGVDDRRNRTPEPEFGNGIPA